MRTTGRKALGVVPVTVVLVSMFALGSGCVTGTQVEGRIISALDVAKVKIGQTTKQDVLDIFGPPTEFQRTPEPGPPEKATREDIFRYEYKEEDETFITFVLVYTYFKRVKYADTLMVVFDGRDIVKYLAFSKQTDAEPEPPEEEED